MPIVKIDRDLRNFASHVFCLLISRNDPKAERPEWKSPPPSEGINIEMKINGVEVDFMKAVDALDEQLDYRIMKTARNMVDDNLAPLLEIIDTMSRDAEAIRKTWRQCIRAASKKLEVDLYEDEE